MVADRKRVGPLVDGFECHVKELILYSTVGKLSVIFDHGDDIIILAFLA